MCMCMHLQVWQIWVKRKKERDRGDTRAQSQPAAEEQRGQCPTARSWRGRHAGDRRERTCKINLSRNNTIIHTNINIIAHMASNNTPHASQENSEQGPIKSAHMGMQFDTMLRRFMHHVYALFKGWHICHCRRMCIIKNYVRIVWGTWQVTKSFLGYNIKLWDGHMRNVNWVVKINKLNKPLQKVT